MNGEPSNLEMVTSFDGTAIAGRLIGDTGAPPLLVVNAVGANLAAWRGTLERLLPGYSAVAWDMRGLHSSDPPATERFEPAAQAQDAIAVLDRFEVDAAGVIAWSNGVRIALEIERLYPERVVASVLVCGGWGYQLGRIFSRLEAVSVLPVAARGARYLAAFLEGPLGALVGRPEIAGLVRQSGMVGPSADTSALVDILRGMAECDLRTMLTTFEAVAGAPAPQILDELISPVLVVGGDRDQFTPLRMTEEMAERIPSGRLEIYTGATHFLPIEFPARLAEDIRSFMVESGYK